MIYLGSRHQYVKYDAEIQELIWIPVIQRSFISIDYVIFYVIGTSLLHNFVSCLRQLRHHYVIYAATPPEVCG